jgi:hypothetical protein
MSEELLVEYVWLWVALAAVLGATVSVAASPLD